MKSLMTLLVGFCCCVSVVAAEDFTPEAKAELEKLQGNWVIVRTEREGKEEPQPAQPTKIAIQGEKLLLNSMDVGLTLSFLQPASQPGLLNISHVETKKVIEGIYELKEKEWIVCINTQADGAAERPTSFDTKTNAKFIKVVLQRE